MATRMANLMDSKTIQNGVEGTPKITVSVVKFGCSHPRRRMCFWQLRDDDDDDNETRYQIASRLIRYTRHLPFSLAEVTVRPFFFPKAPDMTPRKL